MAMLNLRLRASPRVLRFVALRFVASHVARRREARKNWAFAMSNSAKADVVLALHRFGMGPRPGSLAAVGTDPRGALIAELDRPLALNAPPAFPPVRRPIAQWPMPMRGEPRAPSRRSSRPRSSRWLRRPGDQVRQTQTQGTGPGEGCCRDGGQAGGRRRSRSRPSDLLAGSQAAHGSRARRRHRLRRAAGVVLVEPFLRLGRQGPEHVRRL